MGMLEGILRGKPTVREWIDEEPIDELATSITLLELPSAVVRRENKQNWHNTKTHKSPRATLNHLKTSPLNRITVPIK